MALQSGAAWRAVEKETSRGIVVASGRDGYPFVEACCASIRYFCADVPICLIADGALPYRRLVQTYGVTVIDRAAVANDQLASRSFGWGLTKLIALWESPWETFLSLDPDTIVWGNPLALCDFEKVDVLLDEQFVKGPDGLPINPHMHHLLGKLSPDADHRIKVVNRCLFDTNSIEKHFPEFDWRRYLYQYSWTGAFFCRRGLFELAEYVELLKFAEQHPGVFLGGEMGILNFLIFRAAQFRNLRVANRAFQVLVCEEEESRLYDRFAISQTGPVVNEGDVAVIHWTGPGKPSLRSGRFREPMNFMRRKFQLDARHVGVKVADWYLRGEDLHRSALRAWLSGSLRLRRLTASR